MKIATHIILLFLAQDLPRMVLCNGKEGDNVTFHVTHQIPYYQAGWGPYHQYGAMQMAPPTKQMIVNGTAVPP
jgi:hypothetical protein